MVSLASLPDEVLKLVMQHVSLRDRLTSCCLVSKRLHAAAVSATDRLELDFTEDIHDYNLNAAARQPSSQWLCKYGQQLTSLYVSGLGWPLRELPCPNLQRLQLSDCAVQLGVAPGGLPSGIQQCTKLTQLQLWCNIIDAQAGAVVEGLSSLVHLQHLHVHAKILFGVGVMMKYKTGGLSDATLPRLQHLTYLNVQGLNPENLQQLGGLTSLQRLNLDSADNSAVGPSNAPGMAFPTSLKTVFLSSPVEAGVLSLLPADLQDLRVECAVHGPAEGPGSFLCRMARLQHLTNLVVLPDGGVAWPPPGPAYSALTASSSLVCLEMHDVILPEGIWSYVFPAGRKLPHLTCLVLHPQDEEEEGGVDQWPTAPSWGAADLCNLVSCCPSLRRVDVLHLQHGMHVSELHKLTAFYALNAYYATPDFHHMLDASMKGLAAVSQLRHLNITADQDWEASTLLTLTSLTNLRGFCLNAHDEDDNEYVGPKLELGTSQFAQVRTCGTHASSPAGAGQAQ